MIKEKIKAYFRFDVFTNKKILVTLFLKSNYFLITSFLWFLLLPFAIIFHYFTKIRFVPIISQHIGHLTIQPHALLCLRQNVKYSKYNFIIITNKLIANKELLDRWKLFFHVISNPIAVILIKSFSKFYFSKFDINKYDAMIFGCQPVYELISKNRNKFFIKLSNKDHQLFRKLKKNLGLNQYKFFVCIHARSPNAIPLNEHLQSHRNVKINTYKSAIEFISSKGGVCIMMGDRNEKYIHDGVINYSSSMYKSEINDILLAANCFFFLGCSSGLCFLASIFNKPVAHTNMIPLSTLGIFKNDLSINKFLSNNETVIKFKEIINMQSFNYFFTYQYKKDKLNIIDNTDYEILLLVKDMFNLLEGNHFKSDNIKKMKLIKSFFRNKDFSYKSIGNISPSFINYRKDYFEL